MLQRYEVGLNQEQDVLIRLAAPSQHIILTPEQALELAAQLTKHAKQSKKLRPGARHWYGVAQ